MNQELIRKQQDLTARLNRYRHEYYNLNAPSISDAVYVLSGKLNDVLSGRLFYADFDFPQGYQSL